MPPHCLSAEDEQRCRRLLAGATARLRARPAAAAVLVPLCSVRGIPALLYTLRSSRLAGRHKGDVRYTAGSSSLFWEEAAESRRPQGPERGASPVRVWVSVSMEWVWGEPRPESGAVGASPDATPDPSKRVPHQLRTGTFLGAVPVFLKSFPGGKWDPTDQDVVHTALRETREELGLTVPEEHVWGILQPVYDQQKTTVVPVLAGVGPLDPQSLRPNPEEVDKVFALPLAHLLQEQNQGYTHFCQRGHFHYTLPVFLHGPHRVWGLTAIITEFTLQLLAPGAYQPRLALPKRSTG
ncbi:nucleoside diphosphate-linked moiety X motif 8 isoform X1 [Prionailurus bengalensis]|uniref:nucleoside diphosphate-linked moiety X motif 8 isoform X1 n=1 Tax=Prionailurus bengalensis TaxID=37029 RepID=UPI001CA9D7D6|nr:nucleoside diphosphate-linked moiety X motif 8 isoform X1 [Prionailurus bengalensis]